MKIFHLEVDCYETAFNVILLEVDCYRNFIYVMRSLYLLLTASYHLLVIFTRWLIVDWTFTAVEIFALIQSLDVMFIVAFLRLDRMVSM